MTLPLLAVANMPLALDFSVLKAALDGLTRTSAAVLPAGALQPLLRLPRKHSVAISWTTTSPHFHLMVTTRTARMTLPLRATIMWFPHHLRPLLHHLRSQIRLPPMPRRLLCPIWTSKCTHPRPPLYLLRNPRFLHQLHLALRRARVHQLLHQLSRQTARSAPFACLYVTMTRATVSTHTSLQPFQCKHHCHHLNPPMTIQGAFSQNYMHTQLVLPVRTSARVHTQRQCGATMRKHGMER